VARTRTLTNMLLDIRQRTNQENSTFVTDAELTEYLNQELAELWSRLVQNEGQPHYRSSATIPVTAGTALYLIASYAADFWRVQEVTADIDGVLGTLQPFGHVERARLADTGSPWGGVSPVRYRIQGGNIEFQPATRAFTATLYYTPHQPRLVNGADTFDGFNGYEVAAIYGVCATVLQKEESDFSFYESRKERILAQIDALAAARDMSHPERVQDVMGGGFEDWMEP
jgi:hypothetical protein